MTSETATLSGILHRLARAEKENRRMKRAGLLVLVLAGSAMLMSQAQPKSRIVEAEEFHVRDANGEIRARLDSTGLVLRDPNGPIRAYLDSDGLTLNDASGSLRTMIDSVVPGLSLYGEGDSPRFLLGLGKQGDPSLDFMGAHASPRMSLMLTDGEPSIRLFHQNLNTPRISLRLI